MRKKLDTTKTRYVFELCNLEVNCGSVLSPVAREGLTACSVCLIAVDNSAVPGTQHCSEFFFTDLDED